MADLMHKATPQDVKLLLVIIMFAAVCLQLYSAYCNLWRMV
jgi:hypothetical protein